MTKKKKGERPMDDPLVEWMDREDVGEDERSMWRKWLDNGLSVLDSDRNRIARLVMPKELMTGILGNLDRMKHEIIVIIGNEVKNFLNASNLSEEVVKALSQMEIEVNANIKFKTAQPDEDDSKTNKGKSRAVGQRVKTSLKVKG